MPERPPKRWFREAVASISQRFDVLEPERLAAWVWHHGMLPTTKRAILRREYDPQEKHFKDEEVETYPILLGEKSATIPASLPKYDARSILEPASQLGRKARAQLAPGRRVRGFLAKRKAGQRRRPFDNGPLPKPIDIAGYDNLNMVRLVPDIDGLIEGSIVLPKHQFERILKLMEDRIGVENKVTGEIDIEFEEDDETGKRRLIRRGQANSATNLFIDEE